MKMKKSKLNVVILECPHCPDAHIAFVDEDGEIVFSAGMKPEMWAAMFEDVAKIEAKHASKH